MTDFGEMGDLDGDIAALEASLGSASAMAAGFDAELKRIHQTFSATGGSVTRLERSLSSGLGRAIDGVILDGMKLSDALGVVARSMVDAAYRAAVRPVSDHLGGLIAGSMAGVFGGLSPFAQGGAFAQGKVMPFASGGVVNGPVAFPMRGGPEAIMPLSRGPDGRLGVRASAAQQPPMVVMNITTPDVQGFRRSQSQIAAQMSRALDQGLRNR